MIKMSVKFGLIVGAFFALNCQASTLAQSNVSRISSSKSFDIDEFCSPPQRSPSSIEEVIGMYESPKPFKLGRKKSKNKKQSPKEKPEDLSFNVSSKPIMIRKTVHIVGRKIAAVSFFDAADKFVEKKQFEKLPADEQARLLEKYATVLARESDPVIAKADRKPAKVSKKKKQKIRRSEKRKVSS